MLGRAYSFGHFPRLVMLPSMLGQAIAMLVNFAALLAMILPACSIWSRLLCLTEGMCAPSFPRGYRIWTVWLGLINKHATGIAVYMRWLLKVLTRSSATCIIGMSFKITSLFVVTARVHSVIWHDQYRYLVDSKTAFTLGCRVSMFNLKFGPRDI